MALVPTEMIMWEASPPRGLRLVPSFPLQPEPISTVSTSPKPLSFRTARHLVPSSLRVKVTLFLAAVPLPLFPLPLVVPLASTSSPKVAGT